MSTLAEASERLAAAFRLSAEQADYTVKRIAEIFKGYNQFTTNEVRVRHIIASQRRRRSA